MSDSEKLDKQRLKNFKNKGRDLEVKPLHSLTRCDVEQIYSHFSNNRQIIHSRALISQYPRNVFGYDRLNVNRVDISVKCVIRKALAARLAGRVSL